MISALVGGITTYLFYDDELNLEEFSLGKTLRIEVNVDDYRDYYLMTVYITGDKDKIEVIYDKGIRNVVVSAENVDFENDLLTTFNREVNTKYKEKIESGKISEDEIREYLNSLLDYIDRLTDKRAQDILQKLKEAVKGEIKELKVSDVEELKEEDLEEE